MKNGKIMNNEMDYLIKHMLEANDEMKFPENLAERTIHRLEKRMLLRELIRELVFKTILVLASIGILAGVLAWSVGIETMSQIYTLALAYKQIVLVLLTSVLTILILDQIIIRFYNIRHQGIT